MHSIQRIYQTGRSVQMAFLCLVYKTESALKHRLVTLRAFLDIEGAFNTTISEKTQKTVE
jgi:hypothetical protein